MNWFSKITSATLIAVGIAAAPIPQIVVQAQESDQDTEIFDANETDALGDPTSQQLEEAERSLESAGQEAVQGVEAAGETAEQQLNQAAQEAARSAQEASQAAQETSQEAVQSAEEAAQRAELAAENAIENAEQRSNWGWLGLFGLIGLFGLAGGNKRRVETDERYYREPTTRTPTSTTSDYRQ